MADRGFTIKKQFKSLGVTFDIPSYLARKNQLSQEEVTESQIIARLQIHVEKAIQWINYFRQIRKEIPLTMHGSINQIWKVLCLLCIFMPLQLFFFFYLGFLSRTFPIHGTAREGGGYLFNSSLPLPSASQTLRH